MHIAIIGRTPELTALVEVLAPRRCAFHLRGRLLKAVARELRAAKESGLTWRVIWEALCAEGYPGCYQQFCKAANRAIEQNVKGTAPARKVLPSPIGEKAAFVPPSQIIAQPPILPTSGEKPEWQIRREAAMARLDREAEENRLREEKMKIKKIFKPTPFVGPQRGKQLIVADLLERGFGPFVGPHWQTRLPCSRESNQVQNPEADPV